MDKGEREILVQTLHGVYLNLERTARVEHRVLYTWHEQAKTANEAGIAVALTAFGVMLAFVSIDAPALVQFTRLGAIASFAIGIIAMVHYFLMRSILKARARVIRELEEDMEALRKHIEGLSQTVERFTSETTGDGN